MTRLSASSFHFTLHKLVRSCPRKLMSTDSIWHSKTGLPETNGSFLCRGKRPLHEASSCAAALCNCTTVNVTPDSCSSFSSPSLVPLVGSFQLTKVFVVPCTSVWVSCARSFSVTYYLLDANINDDILYKVHQVHEISLKQTRAIYTRSLSYLEIHPGLCQNRGGKGSCWNCFWTSFLGSWSSLKSIFVRQNHSQHGFIHLYFSKPTFDRHFTD